MEGERYGESLRGAVCVSNQCVGIVVGMGCAGKCWDPVLVLLSATEASPVTSELALGHVDAASVPSPHILASLLVAVSVPKKKRRMKELNKKEAVGDLLDAFKEVSVPRHLRITLHPMPSCDEFYFVPSCLGH